MAWNGVAGSPQCQDWGLPLGRRLLNARREHASMQEPWQDSHLEQRSNSGQTWAPVPKESPGVTWPLVDEKLGASVSRGTYCTLCTKFV